MGSSSLEEAGCAIADHFETREQRAGVLGLIVERVQEWNEEPRLYIREGHRVSEGTARKMESDVRVALDKARVHDRPACVDHTSRLELREDLGRRADCDDVPS
jgi:hypothetical protein